MLAVEAQVDRQSQRFATPSGFTASVRTTRFKPKPCTTFCPVERTASRHQVEIWFLRPDLWNRVSSRFSGMSP